MALIEDGKSVLEAHFDAPPTLQATNLAAMQECLASLPSRAPHRLHVAIEEIDKHLSIIEAWVQSEGDSASTTQVEIIELKVLRNAALPIHTLPREILTCVFLICLEPTTWSFKDITRFMSVCASWRTLLEDGWMFWPTLHSMDPPQILDLVLSRNVSGPLQVICSKNEEARRKLDHLELAARHSTRWCRVAFEGLVCDAVLQQLQVYTPNLTELFVFNSECSTQLFSDTFALSEGKPLHHVLLHGVAIPWDTSRLRGLKSLQLTHISFNSPSLLQLRAVLSSSPRLWYLRLSELWDIPDNTAGPHDTDTSSMPLLPQLSMLLLPELSTLVLQNVSDVFTSHLLTHIQAPACRCVVATDIPFPIASDPAFNQLIAPALRVSDGVTVSSGGVWISIYSNSCPQVTQVSIDSIEESVGIDIALSQVVSGVVSKGDIQRVLNTVVTHAPTQLGVMFMPSRRPLELITVPEVLRHLPSTKAIICEDGVGCQDVLRFLITEERETFSLPSPKLEYLRFIPEKEAEVELIRTFLRRHQESSRERANSLVRPLKCLFLQQDILDGLKIEGLLEGLEARSIT